MHQSMENHAEDIIRDLVVALKRDDAEAFNKLFGQYAKRLYYFSLGYLKSKDEAEEIVQEVFFKIWENRKSLNPELSFKAYVFKIAYRRINEVFRKLAQEQNYRHEVIANSLDQDNNLDERTDYNSLLELLDSIVNKLPPRQKDIFIKRKQQGLPVNEIAQLLDIAPKTVENHLTEALKSIKSGLTQEGSAGLLFFYMFVKV